MGRTPPSPGTGKRSRIRLGRKRGWSARPWRCAKCPNKLKREADSELAAQQRALAWVLQQVPEVGMGPAIGKPLTIAAWSNQLARTISGQDWIAAKTKDALAALAATSASFTDNSVPLPERELRAERLVLGLDRLFNHCTRNPPRPARRNSPRCSTPCRIATSSTRRNSRRCCKSSRMWLRQRSSSR